MSFPAPITEYLVAVEASGVANARIRILLDLLEDLLSPEEAVTRVLISEYVDANGLRIYEGAWFFTDSHVFEAREFLSSNVDIDCISFRDNIVYFRLQKSDYDPPNAATPLSRMSTSLTFQSNLTADIKASGRNCEYLYKILQEIVVPNRVIS